jgi:hypothetical protein
MRRTSILFATLVVACTTRTGTGNAPSGSRGVPCYELRSLAATGADDASQGRRTFIHLDTSAIPGSLERRGTIHRDSVGAPQLYELLWWNPHADSLRMSTLTYPRSDFQLRRAAEGGWIGRHILGSDVVVRGQLADPHVDSISLTAVECPAGRGGSQ